MNKSILLVAAMSVAASAAHAEDPPASPFTANVSLTTNYKFRGQDQSKTPGNLKPALQGGFDYSMNGFYVGNWNSNIGWLNAPSYPPTDGANIEMDFYGGYKGELTKDITYDVGVLQYAYPGSAFANVTELYAAVSYSFFTLKYSGTVSKDYFGAGKSIQYASPTPIARPSGRGTGYIDLSANYEVVKGLTLNGHVGYTRLANDLRDQGIPSYTDYKIGATYDLGSGFSVAGALVGANNKDFYGDINKARFIATLTKAF